MSTTNIPFYEIRLIRKKWGKEEWIVNNEKYCMKLLTIFAQEHTSIHRHPIKDEIMILEIGDAEIWILDKNSTITINTLQIGDQLRLEPYTWHEIRSRNGCIIREISTTHDDLDVERTVAWKDLTKGAKCL